MRHCPLSGSFSGANRQLKWRGLGQVHGAGGTCEAGRMEAPTIFSDTSKSSSSDFWRRQCTMAAEVVVLHPAKTAIFCRDHRQWQNSRALSLPSVGRRCATPSSTSVSKGSRGSRKFSSPAGVVLGLGHANYTTSVSVTLSLKMGKMVSKLNV